MIEFKDSPFAGYAARLDGVDPRGVFPSHLEFVRTLLAGIREEASARRYAPGKWSVKQVIGHLADTHLVFGYRMVCLARGETKPLPGFDENQYVEAARFDDQPWGRITAAWKGIASATEALSAGFPSEAWDLPGSAAGYRLTARQMLAALIGHEIHHVSVLKERYGIG